MFTSRTSTSTTATPSQSRPRHPLEPKEGSRLATRPATRLPERQCPAGVPRSSEPPNPTREDSSHRPLPLSTAVNPKRILTLAASGTLAKTVAGLRKNLVAAHHPVKSRACRESGSSHSTITSVPCTMPLGPRRLVAGGSRTRTKHSRRSENGWYWCHRPPPTSTPPRCHEAVLE